MNILGGAWLPDTGYGVLSPTSEGYLRGSLDRATDGDKHKWLVIYCRQDCWMSWNAAKRVLTMGYRNVARYPKGTDGWTPVEEGGARAGRRRIARRLVQGLAESAAEREHALLDDGGHFAEVTNRFAPIVENPRAPFDLRRERVDLGFVLFRLVL
jgi:hypothetical protein